MKQPGSSFELRTDGREIISNSNYEILAVRFDVVPLLEGQIGLNWKEEIIRVIKDGSLNLRTPDGHYTNREEGNHASFGLLTAEGDDIARRVPGVWELYKGQFMTMMQQALPEEVEPLKSYDDPDLALEGYAQLPTVRPSEDIQFRMEAHVDMRYTAVLVIDAPEDETAGGALVIGSNPNARNVEEINQDATKILHKPGTLLCFSRGREFPHYTEEVTSSNADRIVISLNYPVASETREAANDLLLHIKGK